MCQEHHFDMRKKVQVHKRKTGRHGVTLFFAKGADESIPMKDQKVHGLSVATNTSYFLIQHKATEKKSFNPSCPWSQDHSQVRKMVR
jgi:hypothetical protein